MLGEVDQTLQLKYHMDSLILETQGLNKDQGGKQIIGSREMGREEDGEEREHKNKKNRDVLHTCTNSMQEM